MAGLSARLVLSGGAVLGSNTIVQSGSGGFRGGKGNSYGGGGQRRCSWARGKGRGGSVRDSQGKGGGFGGAAALSSNGNGRVAQRNRGRGVDSEGG